MCNAYNHPLTCDCGFGGDTGGGGAVGLTSAWSFNSDRRPFTRVCSCWWCGANVYFYRDESGGCALFDALGAPWAVHSCWEDHQASRRQALSHIESELQENGFDGTYEDLQYRHVAVPLRARVITPFWAVVVSNSAADDDYESLTRWDSHLADWAALQVAYEDSCYHGLALRRIAHDIPVGVPLTISARWIEHRSGMKLFVYAAERHDLNGRLLFRRSTGPLSRADIMCSFCTRRIESGEDWDISFRDELECIVCRSARGGRSHAEFVRHCRRVSGK
jgi:hypothetical protein